MDRFANDGTVNVLGFQSPVLNDDILDIARVGVNVAFRGVRGQEHPESEFDDDERFLWHYALILMDKTRERKSDVSFESLCASMGTTPREYDVAMREVARHALSHQWDIYERIRTEDFFMQGGFPRFAYAAQNTGVHEPEEITEALDISNLQLEGFGLRAKWYEEQANKILINDQLNMPTPSSTQHELLKFWSFERAQEVEQRIIEFGKLKSAPNWGEQLGRHLN